MKNLEHFKKSLSFQILEENEAAMIKGGSNGNGNGIGNGNGNGPMGANGNGYGHAGGCPPPWEEEDGEN